jgi:hypothetical protein
MVRSRADARSLTCVEQSPDGEVRLRQAMIVIKLGKPNRRNSRFFYLSSFECFDGTATHPR